MQIKYGIHAVIDGTLSELLEGALPRPVPTLAELLQVMGELAFMVETVAHLQGREAQLLPVADKARKMIKQLTT